MTDVEEFDILKNIIDCTKNDKSSRVIEEICEYEYGEMCSIEELYKNIDVIKYETKDGEVAFLTSNGEKEVWAYYFNPIDSMYDLVITASSDTLNLVKNNYTSDTFSYFVGNWNYEQTEWSEDKYGIVDTKEFYDSGSLFFGENFRANKSNGDTEGWGYNDGMLEIDGAHYDVIKLTNNVFALYHEREYDTCIYYDFSVFSRA